MTTATPPPLPEPAWAATWTASRPEVELAWRATQARCCGDDLGSDPDWCAAFEQIYPGALRWVRLESGSGYHVLPLRLQRTELSCCLGELKVLQFHPRVVQLAGEQIRLPESDAAYHCLFAALLRKRRGWDLLRLTVPVSTHLWRWLEQREPEALGLRRYQPAPPVPHDLIEFPPTFSAYASKFSAKTRKNRERELRHLELKGPVRLQCYRSPAEVEPFLAIAGAISRRSYQHKLLQAGLRDPARLRPRLETAAAQGWLRAYILWCGDAPCSFMLGYQYKGRYYYACIGYDPEWAKWDAGTVLHWLALQDMFLHDPPTVFDLGCRGPQKQYFGNSHFEEATIYYFRPGLYPWLARSTHAGSLRLTRLCGRWLTRHQLKPRAQRLIRRLRGC
ncbi:MAG: GNAT family N-acetyltransferase [Acidobacteria bacterium]|nr:MAG: GNAT family N-acetyltransferase [Acidobacteriota bacterium]